MRKKLYGILSRCYGVMMTVSFFAGLLPLIPFLIAMVLGGEWGEKISVFLYQQYYPWVIVLGCSAIVVGLIAMYIGKLEALSVKKTTAEEREERK